MSKVYKDMTPEMAKNIAESVAMEYALSRLVYYKLNTATENLEHDMSSMLHDKWKIKCSGVYVEEGDEGLTSNLLVDINNMQFRIRVEKVESKVVEEEGIVSEVITQRNKIINESVELDPKTKAQLVAMNNSTKEELITKIKKKTNVSWLIGDNQK